MSSKRPRNSIRKEEKFPTRKWLFVCILFVMACAVTQPAALSTVPGPSAEFRLPMKWTETPSPSLTLTGVLTATPPATSTSWPELQGLVDQARARMKQDRYSDAIELWDQILRMDPQNADAYYQRATCYLELLPGESYLDRFQENISHALRDIDQAIALRADIGDYYWIRGAVYEYISFVIEFDADRIYLKSIALENVRKAMALGTTLSEYPERAVILYLILINRCDEALEMIDPLLAELEEEDFNRGGLLRMKSQAFVCLDRLPEAVEWIDAAMFNNIDLPLKNNLKSIYLFQMGQYEPAFDLIDKLIKAAPWRDGERYYLRAALLYELGDPESAQRDLETGMGNTWLHFGLLPYVEGRIALDAGKKEEAIALLQYSEATLDSFYNPLRVKIRKQLADLGAEPLTPKPSVSYPATPIP